MMFDEQEIEKFNEADKLLLLARQAVASLEINPEMKRLIREMLIGIRDAVGREAKKFEEEAK